jgi:nucleotide-binding universal stress UspA family protein
MSSAAAFARPPQAARFPPPWRRDRRGRSTSKTEEDEMPIIKKILFPVDLSEASPQVVPYVREIAAGLKAEVHVLFVARVMVKYSKLEVPAVYISQFEEEIVKGAERKMEEFLKDHFSDLPVTARVISGEPAEEILNYAAGQGMDMIIMGTHGRKMVERIVFGSVATHVVQQAHVPVLTVKPYR